MSRAYTLDQIDRMRAAVRRINRGTGDFTIIGSSDPIQNERLRAIYAAQEAAFQNRCEEILRTYMMAGVSPEELEAKTHG